MIPGSPIQTTAVPYTAISQEGFIELLELEEIFFTGSKSIASPNIHKEVIQIIEGLCQVDHEYETSIDF